MTPERPDATLLAALLPPDVARASTLTAVQRSAWDGVALSRAGRADLAWTLWDEAEAADPSLGPWLAAERGRVLREFGLHDLAEALEAPAVEQASGHVLAMLRVSLTADAVGRGDVAGAGERLERARREVTALPDGPPAARQRLRLTWVSAEVDWISGRPPTPAGLPWLDDGGQVVFPPDHLHGTDFHRAKGLLFAGMVTRSLALLHHAAVRAPDGLAWAVHLAREDVLVDAAARTSALSDAVAAWGRVRTPPGFAAVVAATATARRLSGAEDGAAAAPAQQ